MKLEEITTLQQTATASRFNIYADMDGVFADMAKLAKKISGVDILMADHTNNQPLIDKFEQALLQYTNAGHQFWLELDMLPDAQELWNRIQIYNPELLTDVSQKVPTCQQQKINWAKKHLEPNIIVNCVNSPEEKSNYASGSSILIDDSPACIDPWIAKGGIGILHKNTKDTIARLKELGL